MREFEKVYRVREQDDVLTKMNTTLRSVDLRLDSVEQAKEALESGNHADVDALVQSINEDISQKSAAIQALIDEQAAGFDPDRIRETPEKRFTSDVEIQELKDSDAAISGALAAHASTVDQELAAKLDKDATAADSAKLDGKASSEYATAAEGALAGTAVQPKDLGGAASLNVGTTSGTVAAGDDSRIVNAAKKDGSNATGDWPINAQNAIGVGQTVTDETENRAVNTTYTNSTGRTIFVLLSLNITVADQYVNFVLDGIVVPIHLHALDTAVSCIVPAGSTYAVTGSVSIRKWLEIS